MTRPRPQRRNGRIESFEPMILMSASGTDMDADENCPPEVLSTQQVSVEENQTAVIALEVEDAEGDALAFSIRDVLDGNKFSIDPLTGVVTFKDAPDFEDPQDNNNDNTYDLFVEVSDGTTVVEHTVWVSVTDEEFEPVPEEPGVAPEFVNLEEGAILNVREGQPIFRSFYRLGAVDADGDRPLYSIVGGEDRLDLSISSLFGTLSFRQRPDLDNPQDADGDNVYNLTVRVSDRDGFTDRNISVQVLPRNTFVNDAPVFDNIEEGQVFGVTEDEVFVLDAQATDADGDGFFFDLAGDDRIAFNFEPSTGVLVFKTPPDINNPIDRDADGEFPFELRVSDGINSTTRNIVVKVLESNGGQNSAPQFVNIPDDGVILYPQREPIILDVDAVDADGDTLIYSVNSSLAGIDSLTGELEFFNFAQYASGAADVELTLTVTDGRSITTAPVTVRIVDVDESANVAPEISNVADGQVFEVVSRNTFSIDVDATDANGNIPDFYLSGDDSVFFAVDRSTGELSFRGRPNFDVPADRDGDNIYDVTVHASDRLSSTSVDIALRVVDGEGLNLPPRFINYAPGQILQSFEGTVVVGTVVAFDPESDPVTYSIGGVDGDLLTVGPQTGQIRLVTAPQFDTPQDADGDNQYEFQITATDGDASATIDASLRLLRRNVPVGTPPNFTNLVEGEVISVVENNPLVRDLDADQSIGGPLTFLIDGGPDAAKFTVDPQTGVLSFVSNPDFEVPTDVEGDNEYEVAVRVTDGELFSVQDTVVRVTDSDDEPDPDPTNQAPSITNLTDGQNIQVMETAADVFDVDATDPDDDPVVYSVEGADADLFLIQPVTGEIAFADPPDFNEPPDSLNDNIYDLRVVAFDGELTNEVDVTVEVLKFGVPTTDTPPQLTNATEGEVILVQENTLQVRDFDAEYSGTAELTYSIDGGEDAWQFGIDAQTGVVSFFDAPNFELPADTNGDNDYEIAILVTDGILSDRRNVTIRVVDEDDVNTPANFTNIEEGQVFTVEENSTFVLDAEWEDVDEEDRLFFYVNSGPDASLFRRDAVNGILYFNEPPDFENSRSQSGDNDYEVEVGISDGRALTLRNIVVRVTDVDESGVGPRFTNLDDGEIINVANQQSVVRELEGVDSSGGDVQYYMDGPDSWLFTIDPATGLLSFVDPPSEDHPVDTNGDNRYELSLFVASGGLAQQRDVVITVG